MKTKVMTGYCNVEGSRRMSCYQSNDSDPPYHTFHLGDGLVLQHTLSLPGTQHILHGSNQDPWVWNWSIPLSIDPKECPYSMVVDWGHCSVVASYVDAALVWSCRPSDSIVSRSPSLTLSTEALASASSRWTASNKSVDYLLWSASPEPWTP